MVEASHVEFASLQSVPASVVDNRLRTGYHFQPPRNWINGTFLSSTSSSLMYGGVLCRRRMLAGGLVRGYSAPVGPAGTGSAG